MNRRGFLSSILAAGMAPAVVGSGILMPLGKVLQPLAFDQSAWDKMWHETMLRQAELAASPIVLCEWNGYRWTATRQTVSWSRIDNPANFGSAKALQK